MQVSFSCNKNFINGLRSFIWALLSGDYDYDSLARKRGGTCCLLTFVIRIT